MVNAMRRSLKFFACFVKCHVYKRSIISRRCELRKGGSMICWECQRQWMNLATSKKLIREQRASRALNWLNRMKDANEDEIM